MSNTPETDIEEDWPDWPVDEFDDLTTAAKQQRVAVSSRTRFEVFKRDKFTCQYCGKKAPDVVLNCDHIHPVALGGSNDMLNLITSCRDCNGGKGAVPLSSDAAVRKQQDMLADLEERRQQIEMMLRWRDELQSVQADAVSMICDRMARQSNWIPSEAGKATIRKWLKKFSVSEVMRAWDEAFDTYAEYEGTHCVTQESWLHAFRKVPGIIGIQRQETEKPYLKRLLYIQGILRNRIRVKVLRRMDYLEHLHLCGADLDEMERRAKRANSLKDFEAPYDAWLERNGMDW